MKAESIQKKDALAVWRGLPDNQPLNPDPIPYKHRGTTIDQDGIRICGTKEFITAVLSRLKPLLEHENTDTRLGIAWGELTDKETQQVIDGRYRCSIQVHERGAEAKHFNRLCSRIAGKEVLLTGCE